MGGPHLSAIIYGLAAIGAAFVLIPGSLRTATTIRGFAIWAIALLVIMFLHDPLISLAIVGAVVLMLAPNSRERAPLFLLVAPAVPVNLMAALSMPGVNQLVVLTHLKMIAIVLLAPLLFFVKNSNRPTRSNVLGDVAFLLYILYVVIVALLSAAPGSSSITGALRTLVELVLILVIPYFAFASAVGSERDLESCLKAYLVSTVILASVAIVSTGIDWDYYRLLDPAGYYTAPDYRYGFQRINATANTHSLGYLCGFGLVLLMHLRRPLSIGTIHFVGLAAMLTAAMLLTVSRGAMLGTVVALASYYVFTRSSAGSRTMNVMLMLAGAAGGAIYLLSGDTQSVDPFASVEYRRLLLNTSLEFISENLWFGSPYFMFDPRFLPLLQGQGIIDITNVYLQILLKYGLVGFIFLFGSIIVLLLRQAAVVLSASTIVDGPRGELQRQRTVLSAGMLGWLALVTTTSDVALTLYIGITLLALMRAAFSLEPLPARRPKRRAPATAAPVPA